MKKQKYIVRLSFAHLNHWTKDVEVEAKDKRKAMIAAEKAFPKSKAEIVYND